MQGAHPVLLGEANLELMRSAVTTAFSARGEPDKCDGQHGGVQHVYEHFRPTCLPESSLVLASAPL